MYDEDKLCGPSCPKKECKNNVLLKKKKKRKEKGNTGTSCSSGWLNQPVSKHYC